MAGVEADTLNMTSLLIRLSCTLKGHDWRNTTSPSGPTIRCRTCTLEKPHPDGVRHQGAAAGTRTS